MQKISSELNTAVWQFCFVVCLKTDTKSNALQKELLAYPNPVKDYLNIHNLDKSQNFTIFDLLGKTILKGEIKAERGILNVSGLQTGVYVLKLKGTSQSIRFLKK